MAVGDAGSICPQSAGEFKVDPSLGVQVKVYEHGGGDEEHGVLLKEGGRKVCPPRVVVVSTYLG